VVTSLQASRTPLLRIAGAAWAHRWKVEREAQVRFTHIAVRLEGIGAAPELVELARRASDDEQRHAAVCAELAASYGEQLAPASSPAHRRVAPAGLSERRSALCEVVAACCIGETENMGVLTNLLDAATPSALGRVLRELASDEVRHSRLGWAHLAGEHEHGETEFLSPLIPVMLDACADPDLFRAVGPELEDPALLAEGILPHSLRREVFTRTLEDVVFPGLNRFDVATSHARAWLDAKRAAFAQVTEAGR